MAQDLSNYASLLKEWYTSDRINAMILEYSPLLAMMPKLDIGGADYKVPIIYADSAGHSATFSDALTNIGQSASAAFQVTTATSYSLASLDRRTMLASRSDRGAFLPAARVNIDGAFRNIRRDLAINMYRDGSGAIGRVSSYADAGATGVITLTDAGDAVNFAVGDVLKFSANKTNPTPTVSGSATVTAIDTTAGTVTVSESSITISSNDWIFPIGNYNVVMKGLQSWIPSTAPGATSFFGMNRSVNTTMLGGVRSDGTSKLRYEALIDAASEIMTVGDGKPTHVFLHPADFRQLQKEMEATTTRYRNVTATLPVSRGSATTVGFTGIGIDSPSGVIECYQDRFAIKNAPFMLELSSWKLLHIGPNLVDIIGRESDEGMLVQTSSDGYEIRAASYAQIATGAPGHNGVITNFGLGS